MEREIRRLRGALRREKATAEAYRQLDEDNGALLYCIVRAVGASEGSPLVIGLDEVQKARGCRVMAKVENGRYVIWVG